MSLKLSMSLKHDPSSEPQILNARIAEQDVQIADVSDQLVRSRAETTHIAQERAQVSIPPCS